MHSADANLLRDKILLLGGAAETAIARATRALIERDSELAVSVIAEDDEIDLLENQIEHQCTEIILSGQSQDDLRFVLTALRTAPIIERIADHAVNIAKHALVLCEEPNLKSYIELPILAETAQEMLLNGLDSLTRSDCRLARNTIRKDDIADELYRRIYDQLISLMKRDQKSVCCGVELLFIIKHLERIADYVTNICEMVIYMVEGRVIKHTIEAR